MWRQLKARVLDHFGTSGRPLNDVFGHTCEVSHCRFCFLSILRRVARCQTTCKAPASHGRSEGWHSFLGLQAHAPCPWCPAPVREGDLPSHPLPPHTPTIPYSIIGSLRLQDAPVPPCHVEMRLLSRSPPCRRGPGFSGSVPRFVNERVADISHRGLPNKMCTHLQCIEKWCLGCDRPGPPGENPTRSVRAAVGMGYAPGWERSEDLRPACHSSPKGTLESSGGVVW